MERALSPVKVLSLHFLQKLQGKTKDALPCGECAENGIDECLAGRNRETLLCPGKISAMYCIECRVIVQDENGFCSMCGRRLSSDESEDGQSKEGRARVPGRARRINKRRLIAGFSIAASAASVLMIFAPQISQLSGSFKTFIPKSVVRVTLEPVLHLERGGCKIGPQALTVGPGEYYHFPFNVEPAWRNARLTGTFLAQGGEGNNVDIDLIDENGFVNYQTGHQFRCWYSSGRIATDSVSVALPPGRFYLIVSNNRATRARKSVTMNLQLEYERPHQPEP